MASSRGVDLFSPYNPDVPYFAIKIEDRIYDIEYNYLESFTVTRTQDDIGNFSFVIVNPADLNLEYKFAKLFSINLEPPVSFQYGWSLGDKSPWYRGYLTDYTPEFMYGYTKLSLHGQLMGKEASVETVQAYSGNSVSEIIADIASKNGWVVEDLDQSTKFDEEHTITVSNSDLMNYIRHKLEPIAINDKNEPFRFYSEELAGKRPHIWFVSVNKECGTQKTYNFFMNMGNFGPVLSWSPKYTGTRVASSMDSATFDLDTNDVCIYGNEAAAAAAEGAVLTVYGSTTPDRMGPLLANKWYQTQIGGLSADLEIVGDPTLVPWQSVNVLPMMADGKLHRFTSGSYTIKNITDTIGADYRTSMELTMMSDIDGNKTLPLAEAVQFKGKV